MSLPEPFAHLLREHEAIASAVERARGAAEAAVQYGDAYLVSSMLAELGELRAFMSRDLASHIAQEEEALFPAFLERTRDRRLIDELTVQHDRVREQRELIEGILRALDHHHDEVDVVRVGLAEDLDRAVTGATPEVQRSLLARVRQLDWLLQGHFGDEEDDLFDPGAEVFSPQQLETLAAQLETIRTRFR